MSRLKRFLMPQKGLSLIEAMVAILIVGVSVTAILSLQGTLSRTVFRAHAVIDRIPFIKDIFAQADRDKLYEKEKTYERKIEDPPTTLRYSVTAPSDAQKFKAYPHIVIEKVEAEWPGLVGNNRETLLMVRFNPREQSTT